MDREKFAVMQAEKVSSYHSGIHDKIQKYGRLSLMWLGAMLVFWGIELVLELGFGRELTTVQDVAFFVLWGISFICSMHYLNKKEGAQGEHTGFMKAIKMLVVDPMEEMGGAKKVEITIKDGKPSVRVNGQELEAQEISEEEAHKLIVNGGSRNGRGGDGEEIKGATGACGLPANPNFKSQRVHRGLTQQQLADKAGVSVETVRNIEKDWRGSALVTVKKVAGVLGWDVSIPKLNVAKKSGKVGRK